MKNIFRTLIIAAVTGALMFSTSSCGDKFLNEVQRTKLDDTYMDQPEVLYSMSQSLYLQFRQMFYGESWAYFNAGTDEFMIGGDGASECYNTYDNRYGAKVEGSANTVGAHYLWEMLYVWLNRANKVLERADALEGYAKAGEALGTAYFVRGYDYMLLTNQYGDIPLTLTTKDLPEREFPARSPRKEVYDQIISDLENAYKLLPEKADLDGKIDKSTAAHFLAQAHLWRASECNADWNSSFVNSDLEAVIKYAKIVIDAHPLVARYEDLYANYTKNGACSTEVNSEIVLKASYDVGTSERGSQYTGNMTLCWFVMPYQNAFAGFMQRDVAGGRSYQRLKNTPRYCYFLYDLKNDSRFWKSFKTTWAINQLPTKEADMTYKAKDGTEIYTPDYFGKHNTEATFSKYLGGMYIFNRKEYGQKFLTEDIDIAYNATPAKRFRIKDYNTGKYIPTVKALLTYGSTSDVEAENTSMNPNKDGQFAMLNKYLDGDVDQYNLDKGFRDAVIARSAEDYFFWAEALIRQGKINEGLAVLKPLRDRAQFRAGEERDKYMDGGQAFENSSYRAKISAYTNRSVFYPKNSYFYSVGGWDKDQAYRDAVNAEASILPVVTDGNYPPEDQYVMDFLSETNPKYKSDAFTRAMCYLLNEKSREMYGEFMRYNDLVRTRTLEDRLRFNDQSWTQAMTDILGHTGNKGTERWQDDKGNPMPDGDIEKYNSPNGGNFDKAKHYLRPIPLEHLERITEEGHALTKEEINAIQNPGY